MPTYDYECDACGHNWELFQKITDEAVKLCPECKKKKARRLFGTGAAVVFKGSGFYQTDYRSESYKKGEKAANDSKSESGGKESKGDANKSESTKSESTPAKPKKESKSSGEKKKKE